MTRKSKQRCGSSPKMVSGRETMKENIIKIVIVGDGSCGKTCLLISFNGKELPTSYTPTIFDSYITNLKVNDKHYQLSLFDTAGQDGYDRLRPLSYPDTDVLLICFSVDSPDSYYNAYDKWVPEVSHFCPSSAIVLVCTKVDLRDDEETIAKLAQVKEIPISLEKGQALAERVKAAAYVECSALQQINVKEVFEAAIKAVLRNKNNKTIRRKFKKMRCTFL